MRFILPILLLVGGCATTPAIQNVAQHQDYEMPLEGVLAWETVDWSEIRKKCGVDVHGCVFPGVIWKMYLPDYGPEEVFEHECRHIARGPLHD